MSSNNLPAGSSATVPATLTEICDRLRNIQTNLHSIGVEHTGADSRTGEAIAQAVSELSAVREALGGLSRGGSAGGTPAAERDNMARAVSELKSGEFDVQG